MRITLQFECEPPSDRETTRAISTKNRDEHDLNTVIRRWKEAYQKEAGNTPRVVLCDADPDVSIHPSDIDAIDEIRL